MRSDRLTVRRFTLTCLIFAAYAQSSYACERLEYTEVKEWSNEQIQKAYCANMDDLLFRINAGGRDPVGTQTCLDSSSLLKRIAESRKMKFDCRPKE